MTAGVYDTTLEIGATFQRTFVWTDSLGAAVDLTGYTARMQIRNRHTDTTTIADANTTNGQIVITAGTGTVAVTIPDTVTELIAGKRAVYDLELIDTAGVVTRLVEGRLTITPEVTR